VTFNYSGELSAAASHHVWHFC